MTHLLLHIKPVRCSPTTSQQKLQSVVRPPGRYEQRKRTFFLFGLFRTTRPLACVSCVRMYSLPNKCRSVLVSVLSLSTYPLGTTQQHDRSGVCGSGVAADGQCSKDFDGVPWKWLWHGLFRPFQGSALQFALARGMRVLSFCL